MTFEEVVDQALAMLQRRGRVAHRMLKRHFELDEAAFEDLKETLLYDHPDNVSDDGHGLTWLGQVSVLPESASSSTQPVSDGTQAEDDASQSESTQPVVPISDAERRQLTVMFCDLVGSTSLSGKLDPEDLRDIVKAYQNACTEVIQRYEGYVAQHLGDGILCYFGYPAAHEDDAQRAVRAGLGIIDEMKTLNQRLEQRQSTPLAVRISIHTGLVVVGDIGAGEKQEQLALGETPNIAARIQGIAEPNALIVSDATYRLVSGYFDCDSLGEHDFKGVSEPVLVYRVLHPSGAQHRLDITSPRGLPPLVGRESEVTLLLERWEQSKDGQGQVVLLSGEAGIGKSRLVEDLKDHVVDEPHTRWECRSSPYFTNSALYPLIDLMQRTLRWQPDDTPEQRLIKLEQELGHYRLPLEETVPLFGTLLSLPVPEDRYLPLNWTPQRLRQKTLDSIVAILLELAERQPVLFILDDMHWCDNSTLELLGLIIDQTPTTSLLVVITYRPEFQPTWGNRSYLSQVTLNRLSQSQIESIATEVAGGKALPSEVIDQLADKTDGVPLFVEEMTKAVLESGVVQERNEQYELTGPVSSLSIPSTLQDSLMARLDRLATAKAVAQYASVIGRQFSYELLQAVSELDPVILQRELGKLVEAELVYQRGLPPQTSYTFKHALIQDTAYASLLRSTRQGCHRRIAEVLAERFPETAETQPELVAHHYSEAGSSEQAIGYWQQAGQRAIERSAHAEASAHLNSGLEELATLPESPKRTQRELELQIILGPVVSATKGYGAPEVERVYTRAWQLCQRVEETAQRFSALIGLFLFHFGRGELQTARQLGMEFLTLAKRLHDLPLLVVADWLQGFLLISLGEFPLARERLKHGIALYDPEHHRDLVFRYGIDPGVGCLVWMALVLWLLGYAEQARQRSCEALTLSQALLHPYTQTFALVMAAILHRFRREGPAAQQRAEAACVIATEQGFPYFLARAISLRGWALAAQGEAEQGLAHVRQGLAEAQALGTETTRATWLSLLVETAWATGQVDEGLDIVAETFEVVETTGESLVESELHRLKGELLLQQSPDNIDTAESCFQQALDIACAQQAKSWELRAATSLSRLWQSQDKHQDAYDLLAPVYGWFTEGFDTADLQEAKQLLDDLG